MEVALTKLDELYDMHDHYFSADKQEKKAKLDPCNLDIWVCLGNCLWKKGDLQAAKTCFESCLDYGPSKHALRSLSMLLRKMGTKPEEKSHNIKVHRYKEDYALAVQSFCKAHALDPSLRAMAIVDGILRWTLRVSNLIHQQVRYIIGVVKTMTWRSRGGSRRAALRSWPPHFRTSVRSKAGLVCPSRPCSNLDNVLVSPYQPVASPGHNEGKAVALKLLVDVIRKNEPPGYATQGQAVPRELTNWGRCFVMMDETQTCCAVSIYHLDSVAYTKMTERDVFYVLDPFVKLVHLTYNCMVIMIFT
ncbi:hypothetical protein DYB37_005040 [Aphanomyces astaci]|uniref:Tetratricopeptide repeat protein 5 OB fold domain-containing protein n=1 Tax=Aphanomyces astaci TaxID=112090 RepID=A0A3R7AGA2_APHAT|nr:hypothetical protein DYB35_001679 [Aphanomyces astaci]RHZ10964.1 hypothetical protein DYB37_005040 [Aphanomyces astaci]